MSPNQSCAPSDRARAVTSALRCFIRIDGPDGQMCAQVHTTWVLIEQATGRPRRVPAWITEMFT